METQNENKQMDVDKCGYLQKLCQRGLPLLLQWKRRYFVLSKGILYYYDDSNSHCVDKPSGQINLRYFDQIEADQKDSKKTANVFHITSTDKTIFDPGRYTLAADSNEEMADWIEKLTNTLEVIKNNNTSPKVYSAADNFGNSDQLCSKNDTIEPKTQPEMQPVTSESQNLKSLPPICSKSFETRIQSQEPITALATEITCGTRTKTVDSNKDLVGKGKHLDNGLPSLQTKRLQNLTQTRTRGPSGRRAPRKRYTMQPRASSLSFLNSSGDKNGDSQRSEKKSGLNEKNGRKLNNESYPSFAYFYSDEEDSSNECCTESSIKSLSSNNLNINRKSSSQRSSVHFPEDLSTVTGNQFAALGSVESPFLLKQDNRVTYNSLGRSFGHTSGRSSPAMDALDDLLMNQSIHHVEMVDGSGSDGNDSDNNTFLANALQDVDDSVSTSTARGCEDNFRGLEDFSSELKSLQRNITAIDIRTTSLEHDRSLVGDVAIEVEQIRKDVHGLSSSVNFYSAEFTKIKFEYAESLKNTELVHRQSLAVLAQAEKSKEEYEVSKRNYDELVCELYNFFYQIRESTVLPEPPAESLNHQERESAQDNKRDTNKGAKSKDKSSTAKATSSPKQSGYHSFFQRPSNLLHELASKSHLFSHGDKENKTGTKQRKDSKLSANVNVSKSEKNLPEPSKTPESKKKKIKENYAKAISSPKLFQSQVRQPKIKTNKIQSNILPTDDIPMMDESVQPEECMLKCNNSPKTKTGINHISINVQSTEPNVGTGRSGTILNKNVQLRKCQIRTPEMNIVNLLTGTSSPPESHFNILNKGSLPSSPILRNNLNYEHSRDKLRVQNCFGRQLSLPESHENANQNGVASNSRYPIVRQISSPNLPLKRQSSGGNFPLMRENSLGIVREEGMSRQSSLLSVPEERLIVDRTLPGSLTGSMASFRLSPSPSGNVNDLTNLTTRTESQTEPVTTSSSDQVLHNRLISPASEFFIGIDTAITSSLKKKQKVSKVTMKI